MSERRLIIFGTSGHGRVVADAARSASWELVGWADENPEVVGHVVDGAPVLALGAREASEAAGARGADVLVAVGHQKARKRIFDDLRRRGVRLATVVHPAATVAEGVTLGEGTVVVAGAVINPGTTVGANCIVNTLASVDHDCRLEDHVHISPGAHLGGTVAVGTGTHVGIGATVRNNVTIGEWSLVGAGAVVVSDLPGGVVAFGVPARVQRERVG